jgi:hypothetical protein
VPPFFPKWWIGAPAGRRAPGSLPVIFPGTGSRKTGSGTWMPRAFSEANAACRTSYSREIGMICSPSCRTWVATAGSVSSSLRVATFASDLK